MATDISICSSALVMIGDEPITSFSENTRGAKVCASIYETTRDTMLQSHPWRFTVGQRSLNKLVATPLFSEFTNVFQLPTGFKRIIKTEYNTDYKIYEDKLYSNQNSVNLEYTFVPEEKDFPSYFVRVLELKMAVLLALSVAEDQGKANAFNLELENELRSAKSVDNQSKQTDNIPNRQLIDVRFI